MNLQELITKLNEIAQENPNLLNVPVKVICNENGHSVLRFLDEISPLNDVVVLFPL